MMDRRYQGLVRIEDAQVGAVLRDAILSFAQRVCGLVGVSAAFDRVCRDVFFYRGDPGRGVYRMPVFNPDGTERCLDQDLFDGVCHCIRLSTAPAAMKDRWARQHDGRESDLEEMDREAFYADRRYDAIDSVQRRQRCRVVTSG